MFQFYVLLKNDCLELIPTYSQSGRMSVGEALHGDDITKFVDSGLSIQAQEVNNSFEQINKQKIT